MSGKENESWEKVREGGEEGRWGVWISKVLPLAPICSQGARTKEDSVTFSFLSCQTTSDVPRDFSLVALSWETHSWRTLGGGQLGYRMTQHPVRTDGGNHGLRDTGGQKVYLQMDETCSPWSPRLES